MTDDRPQPVSPQNATLTADALKAMGHPLRWRILCVLGDKEATVGDLARQIGTTQSNMSQHLDQLRNKRILVSRKEANRKFYDTTLSAVFREVITLSLTTTKNTNLNKGLIYL